MIFNNQNINVALIISVVLALIFGVVYLVKKNDPTITPQTLQALLGLSIICAVISLICVFYIFYNRESGYQQL